MLLNALYHLFGQSPHFTLTSTIPGSQSVPLTTPTPRLPQSTSLPSSPAPTRTMNHINNGAGTPSTLSTPPTSSLPSPAVGPALIVRAAPTPTPLLASPQPSHHHTRSPSAFASPITPSLPSSAHHTRSISASPSLPRVLSTSSPSSPSTPPRSISAVHTGHNRSPSLSMSTSSSAVFVLPVPSSGNGRHITFDPSNPSASSCSPFLFFHSSCIRLSSRWNKISRSVFEVLSNPNFLTLFLTHSVIFLCIFCVESHSVLILIFS
jgi:hypothetical protein